MTTNTKPTVRARRRCAAAAAVVALMLAGPLAGTAEAAGRSVSAPTGIWCLILPTHCH